jgi:dihydroneopterin aldolase
MIVEVHGLELFGRHGVNDDERRDGQTFLFDVTLEIAEPEEDAIEATIDYRLVRDIVRAVNDAESYRLLETLAAAVADRLNAELRVQRVRVSVRKPGIAWAEWTGVTCERP